MRRLRLPGIRRLDLGPMLRPLLGLRPGCLRRFLRRIRGNKRDHGRAIVLDAGKPLPAQSEQEGQDQQFDRDGDAETERAASGWSAEPLGKGGGGNWPRLKQWVFGRCVRGTMTRGYGEAE